MKGLSVLIRALLIRPAARRPVRFSLTIVGVAAGVAVLIAIHLANQSSIESFRQSIERVAGRATHQIVSATGAIDEAVLHELSSLRDEGVVLAPVIERDALAVETDLTLNLVAFDLIGDVRFRDYTWASATSETGAPEGLSRADWFFSLFRDDSLVVPAHLADRLELAVGSPLTLTSSGVRRELVVRAVLDEGESPAFAGNLVLMDIGAAQNAFGLAGMIDRIDLIIPASGEQRITERIESSLSAGLRLERPEGRSQRVAQMADAFRVNLLALGAISVLVGALLVFNTLTISFLNLRPSLGTLYAIGTRPAEVLVTFLLSAALIGLVGSAVGIVVGYLLASAILSTVGATITNLYVATDPDAVVLTFMDVVAATTLGVGISLLAALRPALEAAAVPVAELSRKDRIETEKPPRWSVRVPLIALLLGFAWLATTIPPLGRISIGGYASTLLLLLAGAFAISPALLQFASMLRRWLARHLGAPGLLAAASIPAARRRAVVASVALMVAIAMMVSVAMMVGSFRQTVIEWVDQTIQSDLWLRPTGNLGAETGALFPREIVEAASALEYVEGVDYVRGRTLDFRDSIIQIAGTNLATAANRGRLPLLRPRRTNREVITRAVERDGALVSEAFSTHFDLDVGDPIEIAGVEQPIPIVGVYRDYSSDRGVVVIDDALFSRIFSDDAIDTLAIYLEDGIDPASAATRLEEDLASFRAYVVTNSLIRTEVLRIFDQTFAVTWTLLGIALIVATTGIFSTIHAIVIERIRELALLRVIGMSVRQLAAMVTIESSIIGVTTSFVGALCGAGLAIILIQVVQKQAFGWTIDLHPPGGVIAVSLLATVAASTLSGFFASRYAARSDLIEATRAE